MNKLIHIGMDIGSTTLKIVVTDAQGDLILKDYRRHYADIDNVILQVFDFIKQEIGDCRAKICMTGSAGMGVAERCKLAFVQEVVASCEVVSSKFSGVKTLVDIGGEDAKMIFFNEKKSPEMRMNGNCAGGTGSFIDQIASLLNIEASELSRLAENSKIIYPIASRCGVFCKTDVQNLLSRNVSKEDIAASVFHAVSMQVITSLARGYDIEQPVFVCGGPFAFLPALRDAFAAEIKALPENVILSENAEVVPAWGAAILAAKQTQEVLVSEMHSRIEHHNAQKVINDNHRLTPLFKSDDELNAWIASKNQFKLPAVKIGNLSSEYCYIGIDSGSTTTKIIATDENDHIFFRFYEKNNGYSLLTVEQGLNKLKDEALKAGLKLKVKGSCVTGYGEDLIKTAFATNFGMVETIAHYSAAHHFNPKVSFILDIGGQDMKATFIDKGIISRIEINEACSSGCGSFIETFALSLDKSAAEFSEVALTSSMPCDLGTRCTVFMNSKVKQSLREGASVADISAGLGYSVIKNCLNKVLKLKDFSELGDNVMVQGGTFRNKAIIRALEVEIGKSVMITDYPELMGAYGAAIYARRESSKQDITAVDLEKFTKPNKYNQKVTICKGCENQCTVSNFAFENGKRYYAGNKCEKIFFNSDSNTVKGTNVYTEKYALLFNRQVDTSKEKPRIGLPRALGMYENYPFWHSFLTQLGYNVVLSDVSTMRIYEKGLSTVMSDNICFPAKLTHGHILNLVDKQVDRIFMPYIVHESKDDQSTSNSFNCPIVSAYSDVIDSAINTGEKYGIPLDAPTFTLKDKDLFKKACMAYFTSGSYKQSKRDVDKAFEAALVELSAYENKLRSICEDVYSSAKANDRLVVLLAGRPYHTDPLIQHKIADIFTDFGVDVITDDIVRNLDIDTSSINSVMQWAYTNRIMKSALWAATVPENIHYVELTSFGCGPDAFILDEVSDIFRKRGKNATFLKVDDINNAGSTRLRIRSLIESLKFSKSYNSSAIKETVQNKLFTKEDKEKLIIGPFFSEFYSPLIPALLKQSGYTMITLPQGNQQSVDLGLKYVNNEVCYPATLIIGDIIKALNSGKYDMDNLAVILTQTGGQCRATNYVSLLKKAMLSAGYAHIPVVALGIDAGENEQPGFNMNWTRNIGLALSGVLYADCIAQMYFATVVREKLKGKSAELRDYYINAGADVMNKRETKRFYTLLEEAAQRFNELATDKKNIPRIGVVGEIYLKHNSFSNGHLYQWLIDHEVEVVAPSLANFFLQYFVNVKENKQKFIERSAMPNFVIHSVYKIIVGLCRKMDKAAGTFKYYQPFSNIYEEAFHASKIVNLAGQFGEGWLIPAELSTFALNGVDGVVSLQPFGCIANHVVSKGISKKVTTLYPNLNILFLDFEGGASEVNILNRVHFLIDNIRSSSKVSV